MPRVCELSPLFMLLACLLALSCSSRSRPSHSTKPIAAGKLQQNQITYQFGIYYLPKPTEEPLAQLELLLADKTGALKHVQEIKGDEAEPTVAARNVTDPASSYAPPDLELLQRFAHGLSREQAEALQATEHAVVLDFSYSKDHVWAGQRAALELLEMLARNTGGLIWDETTREVFTPDAWRERRIASWTEEVPNITNHTVIHAYKKDEYVRAITLGMQKFGLPDVVVEEFSWSLNRNVGHIINLFSQAIIEGAVPERVGEFDLHFRAIKNAEVREPQTTNLMTNATGIAPLSLHEGVWEDGDPQNRLIEITFDRGNGPDVQARQEQIIAAAFGWEDSVTQVEHDGELEEASRLARTQLPALRAAFNKGLAPAEYIQLKAPFSTPDGGREWMWVEVISWNGDKITGLLKNEPQSIPELHGGQTVEISQAKVFDYIRKRSDGTVEGNETGKIMEKRG